MRYGVGIGILDQVEQVYFAITRVSLVIGVAVGGAHGAVPLTAAVRVRSEQ